MTGELFARMYRNLKNKKESDTNPRDENYSSLIEEIIKPCLEGIQKELKSEVNVHIEEIESGFDIYIGNDSVSDLHEVTMPATDNDIITINLIKETNNEFKLQLLLNNSDTESFQYSYYNFDIYKFENILIQYYSKNIN